MAQAFVTLVEVLAGVIATLVVVAAWRHRDEPAGLPVVFLAYGGAGWAFSLALESLTADVGTSLFLLSIRNVHTDIVAASWLYIAVEYADRRWFKRPKVLGTVVGVVVASALFMLTDPIHGRYYPPGVTIAAGTVVDPAHSVFYWLRIAWDYGIIAVGMAILFVEVRARRGALQVQAAVVVISGLVPSVAAFMEVIEVTGIPGLSTSAIGVAVSGVLLLWALFYADFLEFAPVPRRTLMENMDDAVVAMDTDDRVIDTNAVAEDRFGIDEADIGRDVADALADYSGVAGEVATLDSGTVELAVDDDEQRRFYELSVSPVDLGVSGTESVADGGRAGRVAVFREITERVENKRALERRERQLDLMRSVLSRILRHNLRNDLTLVQAYSSQLSEELDGEHAEMAGKVRRTTEDVLSLSEKARDAEQLIEDDQTPTEVDLSSVVETVVERHREAYPDVAFTVSAPDECRVETVPSMGVAIENLVENAAEHPDDPAVSVTVADRDDGAEVQISDDGPGIPESELAVIDRGEETPLQHGSGLGLWIVDWVIDASEASIDFDTGRGGTTVTVEFPE